jgi:preprotein translocase subunit SecE
MLTPVSAERVDGGVWLFLVLALRGIVGEVDVAKVNPGEFMRQVRAETSKVVWPTRQETIQTGILVIIMTTILAMFFLGVDSFFSMIVRFLIGLVS